MQHNKTKFWVAGLGVSAAFFSALIGYEGYSAKPYRDSVGVPTIGIGTTVYPNGQRVKMTDKPVSKDKAIQLAAHHVSKDEAKFRASIPTVALSQAEYDVYMDFAYNFGMANWNKSSMRRNLLKTVNLKMSDAKPHYVAACKSLLKYKYAGGRDCSVRRNNCIGVWKRQVERYNKCIGANT